MPVVSFDPARQIPPRTGAQGLNSVLLHPGDNILTPEQLAAVEGLDYWRALVEVGAIAVAPDPGEAVEAEPETIPDITGLNVTQARDLVANCYDVELLRHWQGVDPRKGVQGAISSRLTTLERGAV